MKMEGYVMNEVKTNFSFSIELDLPYEEAIEKTTDALKVEGFGVLTKIDVTATLKEKLDEEFRNYVILGACNPSLAHEALNLQMDVGLLLPCNAIVYEESGKSVVSIIDPIAMLGVIEYPELGSVAEKARERLLRVIESLTS
jgi:uncharacterized protein (DUF302 family)